MLDLDQLQRLAEGAKRGFDFSWWTEHSLRYHLRVADGTCPESDPPFIAAMSPDTAKKLIAVARIGPDALASLEEVAQLLDMVLGVSGGYPRGANGPAVKAKEVIATLRTALEELK